MARSVRTISVNLNAGTAKFMSDMDKAGDKVRQFGHGSVSDMQASSAAIREIMGGSNVRAVERFVGSVLGLGPVLRAAFPVVGAVALGGIIVDLGKKTYDFFRDMQLAPERVRGSFRQLNASLELTNDQLAVSNARLEQEIAKLEGKHENTLALTLAEARLAADQLADSLQKDLKGLDDLLRKESGNAFSDFAKSLLGGGAGTRDIAKQVGGETGFGGFIGSVAGLTDPAKLREAYDKEIAVIQEAMAKAKDALASGKFLAYVPGLNGETIQGDMKARIETLQAVVRNLQRERSFIDDQTRNTADTQKRDQLQASHDNAQQDRPFTNRMALMGAQIEAVKAKLEAIGKPEAAQLIAKSFSEAQKAIVETNDALARHNTHLSKFQEWGIRTAQQTIVNAEAEATWREKLVSTSTSIDDHIRSQDLLTAAIGKGIEATRAANVETRLMQDLGQHFSDDAWMGQHAADVANLRAKFAADFDSEHNRQVGEAIDKLQDEIELELRLAEVQRDGAEAVRQAGLAIRLRQDSAKGASLDQIKAELDLYNAQRLNTSSEAIAGLNEKIAATQRLTVAILQSADAERKANLETRLEAARRTGGGDDVQDALRRQDQADHGQEIARAAVQADRVRAIGEQIAKLTEAKAIYGDTLAIEVQLRTLENERLQAIADQMLAVGDARNGIRAFFVEMQETGVSTARIIHDAMHSMFEDVASNLAKMATGQHSSWGKDLQQVGQQMTQASIKSTIQHGLSWVGGKLGVDASGLAGKPDGSSERAAFWVRMAGHATYGPTDAQLGIPGASGSGGSGNIFSGGLGMIMHAFGLLGPGHATGGPVSPGTIYPVGENGPEFFAPGVSGSIIPSGKMGGGDVHNHYNIDARGADLGAYNRIARGLEATHAAAVAHSVQATHERSKRVPNK